MKKYVLVLGLIVLMACSGRDVDTPVIDDVSPLEAQVKSEITITGSNFIDTYSQTFVRFNGEKAHVRDFVSITDTEIVIRVPNEGFSGPMDVRVQDKTSNSVEFTVFGPWAYVIFPNSSIAAADTYNLNVKDTFSVSSTPDDVVFLPEGDKAYVYNRSVPEVIVINSPVNQVAGTIALSANPVDMDVSTREEHRAFISHGTSGGLTVIDTLIDTVEGSLSAGSNPGDLLVDSEEERVFVADRDDNTIRMFSLETLALEATSVTLEYQPGELYINPGRDRLVCLHPDADTVSIFRTETMEHLANITVGQNPINGVFADEGDFFFAVNNGSDTVTVINIPEKKISRTLNVGSAPFDITADPLDEYVCVSNSGDDTVMLIDLSNYNNIYTLSVGSGPHDIGAVDGPGEELDRIYVLNRGSGTISVINVENRVVEGTITVGDNPLFMIVEDLTTFPPDEEDIVQR